MTQEPKSVDWLAAQIERIASAPVDVRSPVSAGIDQAQISDYAKAVERYTRRDHEDIHD